MHKDGGANKWLVAAFGLAAAAAAAALFDAALGLGGWATVILGPVSLWWGGAAVVVAFSAALSQPGAWPRDRRARYIACLIAAVVGVWIGARSLTWGALTVLPAYSLLERFAMARLIPPDETGEYVPLPVWMAYVAGGELLGYALGAWASSGVP